MAPPSAASSQTVTIPVIPELYDPNFLDVLLPKRGNPSSVEAKTTEPEPSHPMIDALKSIENRTRTTNNDPAYRSTQSATLDAFQILKPGANESCWEVAEEDQDEENERDEEEHDEEKELDEGEEWHAGDKFPFRPVEVLAPKLDKAWKEDPTLTLRIIWNTRSIHDGKSDRKVFYQAFGWLYQNHPRTAIQNLGMLVKPVCKIKGNKYAPHGYWKDLANIVALAAFDELRPVTDRFRFLEQGHPRHGVWRKGKRDTPKKTAEEVLEHIVREQAEAREKRLVKSTEYHSTLVRLLDDNRFRALYIAVARLFADRLAEDIRLADKAEAMEPGKERDAIVRQITLAGKWAPSPSGSHDRVTNLSTAISLLLFHSHSQTVGRPSLSLSPDIPASAADTHILRSFYQRHILTRLRKITVVTEPLMSSNRWSEILYTRVASVCLKSNLQHFYRHDPERFEKYLTDVESGKKSISGATLMPHTLVKAAFAAGSEIPGGKFFSKPEGKKLLERIVDIKTRGIEAQWKVMLDRVRESGALDNCLAVCDVSGSMGSFSANPKRTQPVEVAVALTLVVSSLARPPFANKFITFSAEPQFGSIDSKSLVAKVKKTLRADFGLNTAFDKVFLDLLLPLAIEHKVKQEDMVKRLFMFTDMQFDEARTDEYDDDSSNVPPWETSHEVIERKFKEAGYELPEIVYWNLAQGADTFPVTHDKQGVALMNGFSPAMLKVFIGEEEEEVKEEGWEVVKQETEKKSFDPYSIMVKAVSKESFNGLVIVD